MLILGIFFFVGSDEGVYAWVVANYALGSLGGDPLQTTGIAELGGASAQVLVSFPSDLLDLKYRTTEIVDCKG